MSAKLYCVTHANTYLEEYGCGKCNASKAKAKDANRIERMDKGPWTFMVPTYSGRYEEEYVEDKTYFKCKECGIVRPTMHEAMECKGRGHVDHYKKLYGVRYYENGLPVGGYEIKFVSVRREPLEEQMAVVQALRQVTGI